MGDEICVHCGVRLVYATFLFVRPARWMHQTLESWGLSIQHDQGLYDYCRKTKATVREGRA